MTTKGRLVREVDQYIAKLPENIQTITETLRKIIIETSTELVEEYKWAMPNYSYKGLVCYLQSSKKHVNLGFHRGNELQEIDTNELLQGTGKSMRHIRITNIEDIQLEVIKGFILEAIRLNEA
ncbi:DUF1801 domain-containing protein [Ureibacillus manganicus]|uniref:YdhG-like domain-containing protein n=1 Tax=Ureibacillus manganicus DSM 26584 TaxID=1384049 RepID=A0A0A3I343_9BACL|nr:DUF1801 domain-containing protein [Ureibacillus manganicus]KGR79231.1 hypothetical protein CD29_07765 [Ureibacillus manganicus DSM 26584]